MGHLGCADEPGDAVQRARARPGSPGRSRPPGPAACDRRERHLAATAATLTDPRTHHTMSRVGAGLVGIDPSGTTPLHPALTLTAPLVQRPPGARRHPGRLRPRRTAPRRHPSRAGAAGLRRRPAAAASGRAEVLVRGRRRPVVGRISMDQLVVDLGAGGVDAGRDRDGLRPRRRRRADRRGLGRLGRTPSSTRSSPASAPASAPARLATPHLRSCREDPGGRDRRRPELRARGLPRLGGAVAGALDPATYDVVPLTIGRDGTWRDRRTADGPVRRRRSCAAATWCSRSCTARGARTAPSPRSASSPACATSAPGSGAGALAMDKWATKLVAGAVGIATAPGAPRHPGDRGATSAGPARSWSSRSPPGSSLGVTLVARRRRAAARRSTPRSPSTSRALVEDVVVGREIDVAVLRRADGSLFVPPAARDRHRRALRLRREVRRPRRLPGPRAARRRRRQGARGRRASRCSTPSAAPGSPGSTSSSPSDGPVLNEVNTMPGMTEHSQVPRMFAAAGLVLRRPARRARPRRPPVTAGPGMVRLPAW